MRFSDDISCCHNCEFFVQHYTYIEGEFREVDRGHCIARKRSRFCRATDDPCENWQAQTEDYKQRRRPKETFPTDCRLKKRYHICMQVYEET